MSRSWTEFDPDPSTGLTPIQCLTLALGLALAISAALSWGNVHRTSSHREGSTGTTLAYAGDHRMEVPETVFYLVSSDEAASRANYEEATALAEHWLLTGIIPRRSTVTFVARTPEQEATFRALIESERIAIEEAGGRVTTEDWLTR